MCFLADERYRNLAFAPEREVECHAAQHRDDDVDDLRRNARQLENGDRLVVDRNAEQAPENLRHAVEDGQRSEHEGVPAILRDRFDAVLEAAIGREILLVLELAHALVDERKKIGNAIGNRRIDGAAAWIA